ncbi:MAG: hypothetical protein ACOH18_02480 [Candidatus Saccharimonadaceae bacterium]
MLKVEYLLLTNKESACNTIGTFTHLLQSRSDILISKDNKTITYDGKKRFQLEIKSGEMLSKSENEESSMYFDITITAKTQSHIKDLTLLLRAVKKALGPISNASSIQILWDDVSTYYSEMAYPRISKTENLMRKLISKFMHINVGIDWTSYRVPDDVKKDINKNNNDDNFLFNIDFIKLKDVLLSESYINDRDALIKELKTSTKSSFTKEEIVNLLPVSNWDKYFSSHVNCESDKLDKLWTTLYDLRCKVAHNKTFTASDLAECERITEELNKILIDAINKLGEIKLDKEESEVIFDEVLSNSRKDFVEQRRKLSQEYREFQRHVFKLSSPYQTGKKRTFRGDIELLKTLMILSEEDTEVAKRLIKVRNNTIHSMDDNSLSLENWNSLIQNIQKLNDKLSLLRDSQ